MKRKLLYLTSIILFSASSINAQIKYIDLGGYTITASGYESLASVADINLAFYGSATYASGQQIFTGTKTLGTAPTQFSAIGGTDLSGRIYSGVTNQTSYATTPTLTPTTGGEFGAKTARIQYNGAGRVTPDVRRQFGVSIPAGETVTIILSTDSATPSLNYYSTSNSTTNVFTNPGFTTSNTYAYKITNSTASTDTYTFWDSVGKLSIYRVYFADVTVGYTLSNESFEALSNVDVYSANGEITVSNVTSATKISVYNVLGSLVKSIETNQDSNLDVDSGLYIVKAQSEEGLKTVKILVK